MRNRIIFFATLIAVLTSPSAWAVLRVEPVVGFLSLHNASGDTNGLLIYGGRIIVGKPTFSVESEYFQGSASEVFTNPNETVKITDQVGRLGFRTTQALSKKHDWYFRFGAQASKTKIETIAENGSSLDGGKLVIKPYIGAGVELLLSKKITISGDIAYVINGTDYQKNDLMSSVGLSIHF